MDAKGDFIQINSILLLAKITNELFKYYKNLKTQFFAYLLSYNEGII